MLLMWRARKSVAASYVRLLAQPPPPHGTAGQWLDWLRYQARSSWYHQRTRVARDTEIALAK